MTELAETERASIEQPQTPAVDRDDDRPPWRNSSQKDLQDLVNNVEGACRHMNNVDVKKRVHWDLRDLDHYNNLLKADPLLRVLRRGGPKKRYLKLLGEQVTACLAGEAVEEKVEDHILVLIIGLRQRSPRSA